MNREKAADLSKKLYLILSGTVFLLVGLLHLLRLVFHWPIVVGPRPIPFVLSYVGFPIATAPGRSAFGLFQREA